jgi:phenylacetate-coenzyme A ligase PaaK-like adenylate-forming protein
LTTPTVTSLDRLRPRVHAGLYARLPAHVDRLSWSAEQIATHQRDALRSLLTHARAHSTFHAARLAGIEPDRFELSDLASLPVMTKADTMADLDDILTDPRLSAGLVRETLAASGMAPRPLFDEFLCMAFGGSSGRRGYFVYDVDSLADLLATLMRSTVARMPDGLPTSGLTIAMVGASSPVHGTGLISHLLDRGPVRFVPVPATLGLDELVERLNRLRAPLVYAYPSMLALLAREQRTGRLAINPTALTAHSETLLPEHRAAIAAAFDAPILNVYGSSEGLFGGSGPNEAILTFASDMCIVELVDTHNRPVPMGTPSAKVLVTNLYNRVQPLIRYELTDSFVRQPDLASQGHLRATVVGRAPALLHYRAVDVHPAVISNVLIRIPEILDYQVQQTVHGIDLAVLADSRIDDDSLRDQLAAALACAGLPDPRVTVSVAATLHRHEETGKLRRFIPAS